MFIEPDVIRVVDPYECGFMSGQTVPIPDDKTLAQHFTRKLPQASSERNTNAFQIKAWEIVS